MTVTLRSLPSDFYAATWRGRACVVRLLLGLAVIGTPCQKGWRLSASELSASEPGGVRLNPNLPLEQYDYREWSIGDGLPSDQVVDTLQTRDGYLWLATERGLARFDGVKFTNFNRSNTPAFVTNKITTLFEGRDGTLWIGTLRGGLVRCRPGHPPENSSSSHWTTIDYSM